MMCRMTLCFLALSMLSCSDATLSFTGPWVADVHATIAGYAPEDRGRIEARMDALSKLRIELSPDGSFHLLRSHSQSAGTYDILDHKGEQAILLIRGFGYTQRLAMEADDDRLRLTQGLDVIVMKRP